MLYSQLSQRLLEQASSAQKFVLALSGGLDSRVLLHLLGRFKKQHPTYQYIAVHVHHGLSQNADDWMQQCEAWCQQENIEFHGEKVQLELGARISIEQAARDARYQALAKYVDNQSLLLTAHHQGDQLETFLLALKRGSGPKGLSAMAFNMPFAGGELFRPLLDLPRTQLEQYAQQHQLEWVEDESNQDTRFDRNFIRHEIAPALKQRWPNIEQSVARSAALCAEQESLLKELLIERYQSMQRENGSLAIESLKTQSPAARNAILRMWLDESGFPMPSMKQLAQCWQDVALAQTDAAPIFRFGNTQIGRHNDRLYVFAVQQDLSQQVLEWDIQQALELPDGLGRLELKSLDADFDVQSLKAKSIQTLTLPEDIQHIQVQFKATGILAHPETRQHSRALKKLLQEYDVPVWQRNRIPFLMQNDQLIAVAGLFVEKNHSGVTHQLIWYP
ncbi:MAG: tRNA lysidine(34) synthetase TilS [Vibrio sp.]